MFKALILQAQHNLSDARMEFMIRDRLSWMRFLGFDLGAPTPDENTIRLYRDKLTESGALKRVMKAFDWQLRYRARILRHPIAIMRPGASCRSGRVGTGLGSGVRGARSASIRCRSA